MIGQIPARYRSARD